MQFNLFVDIILIDLNKHRLNKLLRKFIYFAKSKTKVFNLLMHSIQAETKF